MQYFIKIKIIISYVILQHTSGCFVLKEVMAELVSFVEEVQITRYLGHCIKKL